MTILSKLGLMRVSEHERACRPLRERLFDSEQKRIHWQGEANEANLKYKRAITDLAASREQAAELLPDALAMRAKRKRDRDMKAAKRGVS